MSIWISLLVAALFLTANTAAQDAAGPTPFNQRHQLGVRLGAWSNMGGTPQSEFVIDDGLTRVSTDITSASFYLEGFFAYRIHPLAVVEISGGVTNRGDVIQQSGAIQDVGSLNIYPILLQVRFYPPLTIAEKWHPYLTAGVGLYYGRNSIQISNEVFFADLRESSETTANFVLGAGLDWALASQIGLELNAKYMPAEFGDGLLNEEDWRALTVTVGVKYLWASKKKN
jgi:opacity protein-like surface antigen